MAAYKARLKHKLGALSKGEMLVLEDAIEVHLTLPKMVQALKQYKEPSLRKATGMRYRLPQGS
jgi:hypothetical protein